MIGINPDALAEQLANTSGHLRLWDTETHAFIWSNSTEPPEQRRLLVDVLAERGDWTAATFDWPGRGRVWAGRVRLNEAGTIEARQELEFLTSVGFHLYSENGILEEAPTDD